jgi:hypothetical protein
MSYVKSSWFSSKVDENELVFGDLSKGKSPKQRRQQCLTDGCSFNSKSMTICARDRLSLAKCSWFPSKAHEAEPLFADMSKGRGTKTNSRTHV